MKLARVQVRVWLEQEELLSDVLQAQVLLGQALEHGELLEIGDGIRQVPQRVLEQARCLRFSSELEVSWNSFLFIAVVFCFGPDVMRSRF